MNFDEQFVELLEMLRAGILSQEHQIEILEAILGNEVQQWVLNADLREIKDAWILMMISHLSEQGVDNSTYEATINLTRVLFAEKGVFVFFFRIFVSADRLYLEMLDFIEILGSLKYVCNFDGKCDQEYNECSVIGCICPSLCVPHRHRYHDLQGGGRTVDYPICFHHAELFKNEDSIVPFSTEYKPGTGKFFDII